MWLFTNSQAIWKFCGFIPLRFCTSTVVIITTSIPNLMSQDFLRSCKSAYHSSFPKAFWISMHNWKKIKYIDYIWPVEFDGDTFQILGWGCDILILASFDMLHNSTRWKCERTKSFQSPYKHASRMTFLLQTQKTFISNAWYSPCQ